MTRIALALVVVTALWWALIFPLSGTAEDCFEFFSDAECSTGDTALLWTWFVGFALLIVVTVAALVATVVRAVRRRRIA